MHIILRASSLFLSRALSIAGFFLISSVMIDEDFKDYAFYFSSWQIASQLIGLQFAFTLFRCSHSSEYKKPISDIVSNISIISLGASTLTIASVSITGNLFIACAGMAVTFSLFNMATEFCRSQREEAQVFLCFAIPGISMVGIFTTFFILNKPPSRDLVIFTEIVSHTIATLLACKISGIKIKASLKGLAHGITSLIPAWRAISLPLIPNNIIWYLYFNLPQVIMYSKIQNFELYNKQAIILRVVVVLSTIASTASLITQKPLIKIYEESPQKYKKLKEKIAKQWLPAALLTFITISLTIKQLNIKLIIENNELINYAISNITLLSITFWLFFSNYTTAHFFIAEKNTKLAAKTMLAGFFVYISSGAILYTIETPLTEIPIYAITAALSTTLTFRYILIAGR